MSREAELYKDKVEVSLDGRQIFYLFFGGAVIVGLVFVLGVMVGRRVEARGHLDRAQVAASVDPLAALDRLEGGNGLSFQGALRGADAPASDVEKKIEAMKADGKPGEGKAADAKGAEDKASETKATEGKAESKAEGKAEGKAESKASEGKASEGKASEGKASEGKASEGKASEGKASEGKAEGKATAGKADGKANEAKVEGKPVEGKGEGKAADARATEAKATTDKPSHFTLQLSAFQDKQDAEAYLDSVKSAGYAAYVAEANVDGKQYFRIRMGSYSSVDAANAAKADYERQAKKAAIVTRL